MKELYVAYKNGKITNYGIINKESQAHKDGSTPFDKIDKLKEDNDVVYIPFDSYKNIKQDYKIQDSKLIKKPENEIEEGKNIEGLKNLKEKMIMLHLKISSAEALGFISLRDLYSNTLSDMQAKHAELEKKIYKPV